MHEIFQKRHCVRSFQSAPVEADKLQAILEAGNSAPSAGNLKAREIVVVKDQETKLALAKAALEQEFIAEAPIILVFCAVPGRSGRKYGNRGRELYSLQDATLAASFAWLQAVSLGLGACWLGAFQEEEVKNILKLQSDWRPVALLPIGYEA